MFELSFPLLFNDLPHTATWPNMYCITSEFLVYEITDQCNWVWTYTYFEKIFGIANSLHILAFAPPLKQFAFAPYSSFLPPSYNPPIFSFIVMLAP